MKMMRLVYVTIWDCLTHVPMTSMTSSVERTDLDFKISVALVYTVCHSICIIWTHYSMAEPQKSNFRVITTHFWGVQIFRKFAVLTLFLGRLRPPKWITSAKCNLLSPLTGNCLSWISGRWRMAIEIISWTISPKVMWTDWGWQLH